MRTTSAKGASRAKSAHRMFSSACDPFFAGLMNGPSMCAPSTRAPARGACIAARTAASAAAMSFQAHVIVVGRNDVTPVCGRKSCMTPSAAAVASIVSAPLQPWMCTLRNPGAT